MFSSRLPAELTRNAVAESIARARRGGAALIDLTETNPTRVGLAYPPLDPSVDLADYEPAPLGLGAARTAVAREYGRHGLAVDPDDLVLTASTSEAYGYLFKLLCDPGDAVLVPQPSYPLFETLASLEAIHAAPYWLSLHEGWTIDRPSLEARLSPATRAILVVSPNNPTGSMLTAEDRDWLVDLAAGRHLALISDEVFADYRLRPRANAASLAGESRALTFALGGLSKSAGLPQMKLGWILVSGPEPLRRRALERLELIADTYLSVSTPVQRAAPALLAAGAAVRDDIQRRLRDNLDELAALVSLCPSLTLFEPEGGWSAVLRIPAVEPEDRVVVRLIEEAGVIVHPGYFFDFTEPAFLVVSLLPRPREFREGLRRLAGVVNGLTP